jgi:hypothetical protein
MKIENSLNEIINEIDRLLILEKNDNPDPDPDDDIDYFDFGGIADIPYARGAKFYYLTDMGGIDVGKILGIQTKDKYGYYDEVVIENWENKIRRYYPTSECPDLKFLYDKKIPYAFTTKDGNRFHLGFKLLDPTLSVSKLDDKTNACRGWGVTYPGTATDDPTDSRTGYFRGAIGQPQVPYNIIQPIIPGDLSTFDLDTRSGFDKFVDSSVGLIAQVAVAIVVTILTRKAAMGITAAQGIVSTNVIRARLFAAAVFAEAAQGVPMAIYYFNRPGHEAAGWMSLMFIGLPAISRYTGLKNVLGEFSDDVCLGISKKIMESNIKKFSVAEMKVLLEKMTLDEKALFLKVIKESGELEKYVKQFEKELGSINPTSLDFKVAKSQIDELLNAPPKPFFKTLAIDFGITYTYAKLIEKIANSYYEIIKNDDSKIGLLTTEEQKKIADNLKKVEAEIKKFPEWAKYYTEEELPSDLTFEFTDKQLVELCEKGVLSDKLKKELYDKSAKYAISLLEKAKKEGKALAEEIVPELRILLIKYLSDPEYKKNVSPDLRKQLEDLMAEDKKKYPNTYEEEETKTVDNQTTQTQDVKFQYYRKSDSTWVDVPESQYNIWKSKGYDTKKLTLDATTNEWIEVQQ